MIETPVQPMQHTQLDTCGLVEQGQGGDQKALDLLFERVHPHVLQVMRCRFGSTLASRVDAADLTQAVCLTAFERLKHFRSQGPGSFRRWLRTILLNQVREQLSFHRAAKRDVRREVRLSVGHDVAGRSPTPSRQLIESEQAKRLAAVVDRLPLKYRQVVVERFSRPQSWEQTAERLNLSVAGAKMRFQRAIQKLREFYGRDEA